jgi:prepilin-type N-terminal cleavage/methylation domain-containing protein
MRARVRDERGFTLIELMVAVLLIGILAAMALSTFLSRRVVAGDAGAKSLINTAQQTAMNYGLANNYSGMTPAALKNVEKTINITANGQAVLVNAAPTLTGYILTVVSSTADTFNLTSTNGVVSRTCLVSSANGNAVTNSGGGCNNGTW